MARSFAPFPLAVAVVLGLSAAATMARAETAAGGNVVDAFLDACTAGIDNVGAKAEELKAKGWKEQPADSVPALQKMIQLDNAMEGFNGHRLFARGEGAGAIYVVLGQKPVGSDGASANSCDLVAMSASHEVNFPLWQQHIKSEPSEKAEMPGDTFAYVYQPVKEYPDLTGIGYTFIHAGGEMEKMLGVTGVVMGAEITAAAPPKP
jgi:hypothetical protein